MSAFIGDWASLLVRWLHFTAGVAWIGASFYFIWVENALERKLEAGDRIAGHLWAIHGGGFYYLEKYRTGPNTLPPRLHWFKWEAYVTWLSGLVLMVLVYYLNSATWLMASSSSIAPHYGIALSLFSLLGSLAAYWLLCATPLLHQPKLLALIALPITLLAGWSLGLVFSPRAVFLHIGAMIGTIMVANVILVIIPAQKTLVASIAGRGPVPDPRLVERASLRSLHNNYLTLPVLFTMISNHYPIVYQAAHSLLALAAILVGGVLIRHAINLHNRSSREVGAAIIGLAGLGAACLVVAAVVTVPAPVADLSGNVDQASFVRARVVLNEHCAVCHSQFPVQAGFSSAPQGLLLDTDERIRSKLEVIYQRAVVDRSMPPGNLTGMTADERELVARWHAHVTAAGN